MGHGTTESNEICETAHAVEFAERGGQLLVFVGVLSSLLLLQFVPIKHDLRRGWFQIEQIDQSHSKGNSQCLCGLDQRDTVRQALDGDELQKDGNS